LESSGIRLPETCFFDQSPRQDLRAGGCCVDVGENDLPEGRRFWRTEWAERCSAAIRR
jgi:hypothetical protein